MESFLFAIFVVCTPDLLVCMNVSSMTKSYHYDLDACKSYVQKTVEEDYEGDLIFMGKCVWRIVTK